MKAALDQLIGWYKVHARSLPWRTVREAYPIWLSEVLLQQTRVQQGLEYYHRFLKLFSSVEDLAAAPELQVMKAWEGLGYYSRARNLQAAARQIVDRGGFPTNSADWLELKGVGPYTARAVACFAYDEQVGVLDGNVFRVLARLYADDSPIDRPATRKIFQQRADELALLSGDAYHYNQGIMELGATLCTPTKPACTFCPLQQVCLACREGRPRAYPVKAKKMAKKERHFVYYLYIQDSRIALQQRHSSFWRGLFTLPHYEAEVAPSAEPTLRHIFTHFTMWLYLEEGEAPPHNDWQWVAIGELADYPLPVPIRTLLQMRGML